jgi:hypothetical protein
MTLAWCGRALGSALNEKRGRIPTLPTFRSSGTLVDIADRDALFDFNMQTPPRRLFWSCHISPANYSTTRTRLF